MHPDFKTKEWNQQLKNLPDLIALKRAFQDFSDIDFSGKTLEEIEKAYFERIGLWAGQSSQIDPPIINLLKVIRVRDKVGPKENIQLASTFSYPLPQYCSKNGRANVANYPVFYGAADRLTASIEVKPNVGDIIYMGYWKINCDRKVNFAPILRENLPSNNIWKAFAETMLKKQIQFAKKIGMNKSAEIRLLHDQIASWFLNEELPYSKTSWIANKYLYAKGGMDFIVYPSFVTSHVTCSLAFHPNFVDKYFQLEKVFQFMVETNEIPFKASTSLVGTPNSSGTIIWDKAKDEDFAVMYL